MRMLFIVTACMTAALHAGVITPVPVDEVPVGRAALVDTDVVCRAEFVKDFEVDGDETKAVWRIAEPIASFKARGDRTDGGLKTEVRLLYSARALYICGVFHQPMEKMLAKYDQNDQAVHSDDCLEMLLHVPGKSAPHLLHFAVNPLGSVYDARDGVKSYHVGRSAVKTRRYGDRWTLEMKLPYSGIPLARPFAGDFVGVRFCRFVNDPKSRVSVPVMKGGAINACRNFAKLLFAEPKTGGAAMRREAESYRRENLRRSFYARHEALQRRITECRNSLSGADAGNSFISNAVAGVSEMGEFLSAFSSRNASAIASKALPSESERLLFYSMEEGFRSFAAARSYLVWPMDVWEKGSLMDRPPADYSPVTSISFEQAGNERQAVGLCFEGLLSGMRLDLRLVPTAAYAGKKKSIPCDAFEVYQSPFVRYDGTVLTDPLVKSHGNIITLSPGVPTRVWIVFNSRNVRPGEYVSKILLKPAWRDDVAVGEISVKSRVWGFELPETRDWPIKSFFWGPNQYPNDEVQALKIMHSHHITHGWTKAFHYWYGLDEFGRLRGKKPDSFNEHLAKTANEEFFQTAKRLGMRFVIGWNYPTCWEWYKTLSERFLGMGFEYEDFVFKSLIADEFKKQAIPKYAAARAEVASHTTNLWFQAVYLSTPPPAGATMEDIEAAKLPEFYKMWTLIGGLAHDPERGTDAIRRLRAKGCSVWDYRCAQHMHSRNATEYFRNAPRRAYLRGLDGTAIWTSGVRKGDDGFDAADGYDDGALWAGNDHEYVLSRNFEAFREGLEDVAYLDRLCKELKRHAVAGKKYPEYDSLEAEFALLTKEPDPQKMDKWCQAAGRAVDRLAKDLKNARRR